MRFKCSFFFKVILRLTFKSYKKKIMNFQYVFCGKEIIFFCNMKMWTIWKWKRTFQMKMHFRDFSFTQNKEPAQYKTQRKNIRLHIHCKWNWKLLQKINGKFNHRDSIPLTMNLLKCYNHWEKKIHHFTRSNAVVKRQVHCTHFINYFIDSSLRVSISQNV